MNQTTKDALEVAKKARTLLRRGWTKGTYKEVRRKKDGSETYGYCLIGAIREADGHHFERAYDKVTETVVSCIPGGFGIAYWNDRSDTTKKEVLVVINNAISKLEAELA